MAMDRYDYELPEAAIAQTPREPRHDARLLVATDPGGAVDHLRVRDLAGLVRAGDVIVVNDTKVLPARLRLHKITGGAVEVLLLEPTGRAPEQWHALVRPGRRVPAGTTLVAGERPALTVGGRPGAEDEDEDEEADADGRRVVTLLDPALPEQWGQVALPPYIHRPLEDPGRYQTVYAAHPGAVAAPTAGLHLTAQVLDGCRRAGAHLMTVDLTVGLGTFRPVTAERPEDHRVHTEAYAVPESTLDACRQARSDGRRVIAVGTTTVRALESAAATGQAAGRTALFIHGDYPFRVVDVLLTNFHLPRSSLLLLLEAFCGPRWRELYAVALGRGYGFLSFGDAMVVARRA
ncbi:MAG TPA: tRNA preQ1(34) S-adenosylmethionine ribosyltransferase-isomerase QueA [Acidimicrobiales bacterium]